MCQQSAQQQMCQQSAQQQMGQQLAQQQMILTNSEHIKLLVATVNFSSNFRSEPEAMKTAAEILMAKEPASSQVVLLNQL